VVTGFLRKRNARELHRQPRSSSRMRTTLPRTVGSDSIFAIASTTRFSTD
jgi:hypothetical protein